VQIVLFYLKV